VTTLKIAHIGNTSGVPISLAREQSKQGHEVEVFVFSPLAQRQFGGTFVNLNRVSIWEGQKHVNNLYLLNKLKFFNTLKKYDIWHYHTPHGTLKEQIEERKKGHRYLKHYHGTELRHKYEPDFCLVSTPELLEFAPNGSWVPNPLDLELISKFQNGKDITRADDQKELNHDGNVKPTIRLAHYPYYKTSGHEMYRDYYTETMKLLKNKQGLDVVEIYGLPYQESIQTHSNCDITIGKIEPFVGWPGRFELEGMALGKPVICYVIDELYEKFRPPVFRTTKETFRQDLEYLLEDESTRERLAKQGMEYVKRNHDVRETTKRLEHFYEKAK
jgi:glycosyltransferase involved in cell wall biosynthesis